MLLNHETQIEVARKQQEFSDHLRRETNKYVTIIHHLEEEIAVARCLQSDTEARLQGHAERLYHQELEVDEIRLRAMVTSLLREQEDTKHLLEQSKDDLQVLQCDMATLEERLQDELTMMELAQEASQGEADDHTQRLQAESQRQAQVEQAFALARQIIPHKSLFWIVESKHPPFNSKI